MENHDASYYNKLFERSNMAVRLLSRELGKKYPCRAIFFDEISGVSDLSSPKQAEYFEGLLDTDRVHLNEVGIFNFANLEQKRREDKKFGVSYKAAEKKSDLPPKKTHHSKFYNKIRLNNIFSADSEVCKSTLPSSAEVGTEAVVKVMERNGRGGGGGWGVKKFAASLNRKNIRGPSL